MNVYRVLKPLPTHAEERQHIADSLYKDLGLREQQDLDRGEAVTGLITARECFALALSRHFGDELATASGKCGACSWCETGVPIELKKPPPVKWNTAAFSKVLRAVPDRDDPRYLARIAFGIPSPRSTANKLSKSQVFGSMEDHDFMSLLKAFTKECEEVDSEFHG